MLFLLISDEIILFCIDTKILHRVCYQPTIGHLPSNALQTRQSQTLKTKTFSILFSFLFLAIENNSFSSFYFFFPIISIRVSMITYSMTTHTNRYGCMILRNSLSKCLIAYIYFQFQFSFVSHENQSKYTTYWHNYRYRM